MPILRGIFFMPTLFDSVSYFLYDIFTYLEGELLVPIPYLFVVVKKGEND